MSKRTATDVVGYLHNVSPIKANKSFRFQIQKDQTTFKRAICFDKKKFDEVKNKAMSGNPVKLSRVIVQDQTTEAKFAEYVVNTNSTISDLDPVNMEFQRGEPKEEFKKLNEKLKLGSLISVKARLDLSHAVETPVFVQGRNAKVMNQAILYDSFGEIEFTIWDEWIDFFRNNIGSKDYFICSNLLVKEWNDEILLTTCAESSFKEILDQEKPERKCDRMNEDDSKMVLISKFTVVNSIIYQQKCKNCTRFFEVVAHQSIYNCKHCESTFNGEELDQKVEIIVKHSEADTYFKLTGENLKDFVQVDPCSFATHKQDVSEAILALRKISVLLNDKTNQLTIIDVQSDSD